jgi:hypothetical protein
VYAAVSDPSSNVLFGKKNIHIIYSRGENNGEKEI